MIDSNTCVKIFSPDGNAVINDECMVIIMMKHIAKNTIFNVND